MGSVSLSHNRSDVSETQARINIVASNFFMPTDTSTEKYHSKQYQYSLDQINWYSMNNNGTIQTIINKTSSLIKTISIYCRITYTVDYYSWVPPVKNDKGEIIQEGYYKYTGSANLASASSYDTTTICYHPGVFNIGASADSNSSNNIIKNVLTKTNIDKWITHFQNVYHWWNQKDINYDVDLSVQIDEPIKATWFNKCMLAMNTFGKNYKTNYQGGLYGDLITASTINQLNFDGKKEFG